MRDGLSDHWRESYVWKTFKSMKALELAASETIAWRKIPITLKIPLEGEETAQACDMACLQQSSTGSATNLQEEKALENKKEQRQQRAANLRSCSLACTLPQVLRQT